MTSVFFGARTDFLGCCRSVRQKFDLAGGHPDIGFAELMYTCRGAVVRAQDWQGCCCAATTARSIAWCVAGCD